jgi:hypothetical protein
LGKSLGIELAARFNNAFFILQSQRSGGVLRLPGFSLEPIGIAALIAFQPLEKPWF